MKKLILLALATTAHADDVALLEIRFADKATRTVAIEFYEKDAPAHVANFKKLASDGFYEGCAFHRAVPNGIVQTGDPLSKRRSREKVGTGGPGYTLPSEISRKHTRGAVAAARLADKVNPQHRSNGSQFYLAVSPQPQLNGHYTVFGNVLSGLDVLELISRKSTDSNDYPHERIELRKVRIIPREQLPSPTPATRPGAVPPGEGQPSFWRRIWPR